MVPLTLRANPTSGPAVEKLRRALAGKTNHLAAKAAQIAGELECEQLEKVLVAAFERFMAGSRKADEGSVAKTAIAEVLYRIGCNLESIFLQLRIRAVIVFSFGKNRVRNSACLPLVGVGQQYRIVYLTNHITVAAGDLNVGTTTWLGLAVAAGYAYFGLKPQGG